MSLTHHHYCFNDLETVLRVPGGHKLDQRLRIQYGLTWVMEEMLMSTGCLEVVWISVKGTCKQKYINLIL